MTQSHAPDRLELVALQHFPAIHAGDRLPEIILDSAAENEIDFRDDDVLVIAQKVVSKAEGRLVALGGVVPSERARHYASLTGKDPRLVELILQESNEVLRQSESLLITENRLGIVMANAGIDQSNVEDGQALLLPLDPDASAREVRDLLIESQGVQVGVIVADSIGRAWRNGIVGHAIGVAGLSPVLDLRGAPDLYGRELRVTEAAVADELAAAASLLMGQAAEGKPVVLARGCAIPRGAGSARDLLRSRERDLFR